jgi:hypothetical protein
VAEPLADDVDRLASLQKRNKLHGMGHMMATLLLKESS